MNVEVVDSNVWIMMDQLNAPNGVERNCVIACIQWGERFNSNQDHIVVDYTWKILSEYRENIRKGSLAERYLNELLSQPITRIHFVSIQFDHDNIAIVPPEVAIQDKNDRKFIAVALAHDPIPPIVDATDTDWAKEHEKLVEYGLIIHELCPDFIRQKLAR